MKKFDIRYMYFGRFIGTNLESSVLFPMVLSEKIQGTFEDAIKKAQSIENTLMTPINGHISTLLIQIYEKISCRYLGFIPGSREEIVWSDAKRRYDPLMVKIIESQ